MAPTPTPMSPEVIFAACALIAASAIGAILEYCWHAWHHDHRKGHR